MTVGEWQIWYVLSKNNVQCHMPIFSFLPSTAQKTVSMHVVLHTDCASSILLYTPVWTKNNYRWGNFRLNHFLSQLFLFFGSQPLSIIQINIFQLHLSYLYSWYRTSTSLWHCKPCSTIMLINSSCIGQFPIQTLHT